MSSQMEANQGFGCEAFGHLASPYIDGELPPTEKERFATHLDACRPCQRLTAEYRAIDVVARPPVPPVEEARWERAWVGVRSAVEQDRAATERAPLAPVVRLIARLTPTSLHPGIRPLAYAAAAVVLVALLLSVQRASVDAPLPTGSPLASRDPARILSVSSDSPDYMPVVYTTDGAEPTTVVLAAFVGSDT